MVATSPQQGQCLPAWSGVWGQQQSPCVLQALQLGWSQGTEHLAAMKGVLQHLDTNICSCCSHWRPPLVPAML